MANYLNTAAKKTIWAALFSHNIWAWHKKEFIVFIYMK